MKKINISIIAIILIFSVFVIVPFESSADWLDDLGDTFNDIVDDVAGGGADFGRQSLGVAWGTIGVAIYPVAAAEMAVNNSPGKPLTELQKKLLRPFFGGLVDRVRISYNANIINELGAAGYKIVIGDHIGGQTYGHNIYINESFKAEDFGEDNEHFRQTVLLAHELVHSRQYEDSFTGSLPEFGYHYFAEYALAGFSYENNKLEREAYAFDAEYALWLRAQFIEPDITNISPNSGSATGGTRITIAGDNFIRGATVTIGGLPATDVVVVTETRITWENDVLMTYTDAEITARVPANYSGGADVVVTNPSGKSGISQFTYTGPTTIHVSTQGNNGNNGLTQGSAKRTIKAGVDAARSGDTTLIILGEGIYGEGDVLDFKGKDITLRSADNGSVTIKTGRLTTISNVVVRIEPGNNSKIIIGLLAPSIDFVANSDRFLNVTLAEIHGSTGESVTVPLQVDSTNGLAGGEICIAYNSTVLRASDVSSNPNVSIESNISEPGMVHITFASADNLDGETVAEIRFDILADGISPLTLQKLELYQPDYLLVESQKVDRLFNSWVMPPKHNALLQNFPNPFNPETWIPYQLREGNEVKIQIYNAAGDLVREMDLGHKPAGFYVSSDRAAYWNGRNNFGTPVTSGVYFYSIKAGDFSDVRKLVVLK